MATLRLRGVLKNISNCADLIRCLSTNYSMSIKEQVCFPSESKQGALAGVLTGDSSKSSMGLVVLQEWWGMNEVIINEAADISERGNFVTLVPDLYRGKIATDHETAGHYMSDLDWPGAVQDISAAAKYLKGKGKFGSNI